MKGAVVPLFRRGMGKGEKKIGQRKKIKKKIGPKKGGKNL